MTESWGVASVEMAHKTQREHNVTPNRHRHHSSPAAIRGATAVTPTNLLHGDAKTDGGGNIGACNNSDDKSKEWGQDNQQRALQRANV